MHEIRFEHPLVHLASGDLAEKMSYPVYERGGSGNTTNATSFRSNDMLVRSGASYRQVIDVGNWDAATMTNAPGQSGDPRSPFYDNLLEGWANDASYPLLLFTGENSSAPVFHHNPGRRQQRMLKINDRLDVVSGSLRRDSFGAVGDTVRCTDLYL